jgi:hypothetical protein
VVFGLSVDVTGSYGPGWAGTALIFLVAAGVARAWRRETRGLDEFEPDPRPLEG